MGVSLYGASGIVESTEFLNLIKSIIQENEDLEVRMKVEDVSLETSLGNDLGLDSLGLMSIAYELQDRFPDFDESTIPEWKTLKDIFDRLPENSNE